MLSKEERAQYDCARISKDMRNKFFMWSIVFIIGAIASYFISYAYIVSIVIWIILFAKDIRFSTKSAYGKYKL